MAKIYINLYHGTNTAPNPWAYNTFIGTQGQSIQTLTSDLLDDTGSSTGVGLAVTAIFGSSGEGGSTATADAGEFLETVLDSHWRTPLDATSTLTFSGLPSGASYTLQCTAHGTNTGRPAQFTVEGSSQDYLVGTAGAPTAPVSFTGTVDPDGEIVVDIIKAASGEFYGYPNGFILEYTAASSSPITGVTSVTIGNDTYGHKALTINSAP